MSADVERAATAMLVRGFVAAKDAAAVPNEAFTSDARLFAWACALRTVRIARADLPHARVNGRGVYVARGDGDPFQVVRYVLATTPRLDLPIDTWAALVRETYDEIDAAERVDTFDPLTLRMLVTTTKETNT